MVSYKALNTIDNQQKNGDMSNKQLLLKNFMNVK